MTTILNIWIILYVLCNFSKTLTANILSKSRGNRELFNNGDIVPASPALPPIGGILEQVGVIIPSLETIPSSSISNVPLLNDLNTLFNPNTIISPANIFRPDLSQLPVIANPSLTATTTEPVPIINSLNNPLNRESLPPIDLPPVRSIFISEPTLLDPSIKTTIQSVSLSTNIIDNQTHPGTLPPIEFPPPREIPIVEHSTIPNPSIEATTLPSVINNANNDTQLSNLPPVDIIPLREIAVTGTNNTSVETTSTVTSGISNDVNSFVNQFITALPPIREIAIIQQTTLASSSTEPPIISTITISSTSAPTTTMFINRKGIPITSWTQSPPIICPCGCFIKRLRNVIHEKKYRKDTTQCFRRGVVANVENHIINCPCGCVITTSENTTVSIYPSRRKCLGKSFTSAVDKQRITCHCGCSGKTKENTNYIIHPDNNCDCDRELNAEDCKYRKLFRILEENLQE